jgi:hypothetical protein
MAKEGFNAAGAYQRVFVQSCPCGIIVHDTTLADLISLDCELELDGLDNLCIWLANIGERGYGLIKGSEQDVDDCDINMFGSKRGTFKWVTPWNPSSRQHMDDPSGVIYPVDVEPQVGM